MMNTARLSAMVANSEAVHSHGPAKENTKARFQRNTWQRESVRQSLAEAGGFISAQDLHSRLRDEETGIGLATVYRALSGLAESGEVDSLLSPAGESLYRFCQSTSHHHHLVCRSCGLTVEIEAAEVEDWATRTAAQHGFSEAAHVIDIFGLCEPCAQECRRGDSD